MTCFLFSVDSEASSHVPGSEAPGRASRTEGQEAAAADVGAAGDMSIRMRLCCPTDFPEPIAGPGWSVSKDVPHRIDEGVVRY